MEGLVKSMTQLLGRALSEDELSVAEFIESAIDDTGIAEYGAIDHPAAKDIVDLMINIEVLEATTDLYIDDKIPPAIPGSLRGGVLSISDYSESDLKEMSVGQDELDKLIAVVTLYPGINFNPEDILEEKIKIPETEASGEYDFEPPASKSELEDGVSAEKDDLWGAAPGSDPLITIPQSKPIEPELGLDSDRESEPSAEVETEPSAEVETEPSEEVETDSSEEVETDSSEEVEAEPETEPEALEQSKEEELDLSARLDSGDPEQQEQLLTSLSNISILESERDATRNDSSPFDDEFITSESISYDSEQPIPRALRNKSLFYGLVFGFGCASLLLVALGFGSGMFTPESELKAEGVADISLENIVIKKTRFEKMRQSIATLKEQLRDLNESTQMRVDAATASAQALSDKRVAALEKSAYEKGLSDADKFNHSNQHRLKLYQLKHAVVSGECAALGRGNRIDRIFPTNLPVDVLFWKIDPENLAIVGVVGQNPELLTLSDGPVTKIECVTGKADVWPSYATPLTGKDGLSRPIDRDGKPVEVNPILSP